MASLSISFMGAVKLSCGLRANTRSEAKFSVRQIGPRMVERGGGVKVKSGDGRSEMLSEIIVEKVSEAEQICEGKETSEECAVAWDEVEEVSQAKAHFISNKCSNDPLEAYCLEHPDAHECLIYED
ncbi:hypothetical protein SUGI_1177450 [Cryptomeria japonica]|uniref:calvin cycle protein CP12-3, chloroplastic-like n=1 Tax=Cryptomeria japonica TaxID=3369 RepID=UPI002414AA56|nr:calvin cycle protein CP12-3, chloroplastic-like [Cryptomeria japonica]GLJ54824.1 hypothetical protein SUGI_1177450 [Cryptomeria japonica]